MSDSNGLPPDLEDGAELLPDEGQEQGALERSQDHDQQEQAFEQGERQGRDTRRIEKVLRERAEERRRRTEAEAENARLREEMEQMRRLTMRTMDTSLDREIDAAQAEAERLFSEGDGKGHAEAIKKLTTLTARKERLAEMPERSAPQQQSQRFTPATQAWIDRNPRFNEDAAFRAECGKADARAKGMGLKPDTDEYFAFVEGHLEKNGLLDKEPDDGNDDDGDEPVSQPTTRQPQRPPQRGAPVNRSAAAPNNARQPQGQRMPPREYMKGAEAGAKANGISVADYWAQALRDAKAGSIRLEDLKNWEG